MTYRDILVHIDPEPAIPAGLNRRAYALALATAFDARLTGLAFASEPSMPPMTMGAMSAEFLMEQRARGRKVAEEGLAAFSQAAKAAGVDFDTELADGVTGTAGRLLARHSRTADLVVVGQEAPDDPLAIRNALIEAALFDSGRPVLVVPHAGADSAGFERIAIAWDGGRPATRAVHDALPLILRAEAVEVVTVDDGSSDGAGDDIARHLARHGAETTVRRLPANGEPAEAILARAAETGAELVVMGGYGHARLREFLLGGTTRAVLNRSRLPLFMAH